MECLDRKKERARLQLVTDWPTTKPWPYKFSISGDSKILSTTDASVEFMNSVADASKMEIKDDNGALWATVDMKHSAAAIRAIVNCVRERPPAKAQSPEPETRISGTGFFVAPKRVVPNRMRKRRLDHRRAWRHQFPSRLQAQL